MQPSWQCLCYLAPPPPSTGLQLYNLLHALQDLIGSDRTSCSLQGNVLFARFFEGNASFAERTTNIPSDPMKRVQEASSGLVDVPIIMQTMQDAIKRSVIRAR